MPTILGLGTDNPIAWSNFYRKGGFKSVLGTSGAYLGIVAALIFLTARLNPRSASGIYSAWLNGILGLQFLFFVVIAAGRVTATIRGDLTSGMAESLRMMPFSAGHAIVGYLSSAAATLGGFFIANFLLGALVNMLAQIPAERWLASNAILFIFAIFVWTIAGFMAFLAKGAGAVLVIVSVVGVFGQAGLFYVAPGLLVLVGPLVGGTIFNMRTAQTEVALPLVISIAAQILVGAIFFAGAARKYRRPDALALGAWLGLGLLLAMIGISLLAILMPDAFTPRFLGFEFRDRESAVPFCGSMVLALLVAMIPLANFARLHVGWLKGRQDDPEIRRAVPPLAPAGLIVTAVLGLMIFALPRPPGMTHGTCMVAAMFGFCLSVVFLAAWFYRAAENANIVLGIWLICYCLLPLGLDLARDHFSDAPDEPVMTMASSFSPLGLIIEAVNKSTVNLRPGAVFHVMIPLLPLGLYLRRGRTLGGPIPAPAV
jgi:hypothetical protein